MSTNPAKQDNRDFNRDPITGEPGSHPVGTSLGTAAGAAAGMAIGAALGPVGSAAGAVIGTIVGGLAGAYAGGEIAEVVDPTAEEAYWASNYEKRPYVEQGASYESYRPAYRYGYDARAQHADRAFHEVDADLSKSWDERRGSSTLSWDQARPAVRDAFDRTGAQYIAKTSSETTTGKGDKIYTHLT